MKHDKALIQASLAFLHTCISASPLRRHGELFDPEHVDDAVERCLLAAQEAFETDLARWSAAFDHPRDQFAALELSPNLQATWFYRVCRALYQGGVERLPDLVATVARQLTSIEIYYSADIGPGLKIIHGAGTVIGAMCTVGRDFTVYQNVTVGDKLGRDTGKRPVVGDRVIATAGVQILGPIRIGSESVLGANAVVLESLPERCVAAGIPAKVRVADLSDEAFGEFWSSIKG